MGSKGMQRNGATHLASDTVNQPIVDEDLICMTDGSWAEGWIAGAGFVFMQNGYLISYTLARTQACCALQAEAIALGHAIQLAQQEGMGKCTFITDSLVLAQACTDLNPPLEVDWRAHKEIYDIWKRLKQCLNFSCVFRDRSHNDLANSLAKRGRRIGGSYTGFTYPIYPIG